MLRRQLILDSLNKFGLVIVVYNWVHVDHGSDEPCSGCEALTGSVARHHDDDGFLTVSAAAAAADC